ncbi:MAG: helix-turn-helix domain-containing protein [Bdellovibrionales bacterium]|nr:helix-turn-helix domain-containing protein [Bdellovibrionales bacterium]
MTTTDLLRRMSDFGFSEKEAAVYLALAETGKCTATSLSRKTKLSRSSVYFILDSLRTRGLVEAESKNATTYFSASHPRAIGEELKQHQQALARRQHAAEELAQLLLPFFQGKQFHVPKLKFTEGKSQVLAVLFEREDLWHRSMLTTDATWWGFEDGGIFEQYRKWFEHIWDKFDTERSEQLDVKVFSNVPVRTFLGNRFPKTLLKPLPSGYLFSSTLWLMGDFVVLISCREKPHYLYQIEDPALSANLRVIFRMLWSGET